MDIQPEYVPKQARRSHFSGKQHGMLIKSCILFQIVKHSNDEELRLKWTHTYARTHQYRCNSDVVNMGLYDKVKSLAGTLNQLGNVNNIETSLLQFSDPIRIELLSNLYNIVMQNHCMFYFREDKQSICTDI